MSHISGVRSTFVPPPQSVDPPAPSARVLLAEDDHDLCVLMQAFLQGEGYEVFACSSFERAHEIVTRSPGLDLLVTDLRMPGASHFELARTWSDTHPGRPVVIVSGATLRDDDLALILERRWHFVLKPFTVPQLLDIVARALDTSAPCEIATPNSTA